MREAAARLQSAVEAARSAAAELKQQEALLEDQVMREEQAERQALEAECAAQEVRLKVGRVTNCTRDQQKLLQALDAPHITHRQCCCKH